MSIPFPMINPPPRPGKLLICTGRKRDGKSWFIYHSIFKTFQGPAIYIDPKGADPYISGEVRRSFAEVISKPAQKIIFQPLPGSSIETFDGEVKKVLEYLPQWVRNYPGTPLLIVVDESQRYMSRFEIMPELDNIIQTCPALNISTVLISPDYSQIPRQMYFQSDYVAFMSYHEIIVMYLDERFHTNLPPEGLDHLKHQFHGIMIDWRGIYLIYPDGSLKYLKEITGGEEDKNAKPTEPENVQGIDTNVDRDTGGPEVPKPIHDGKNGIERSKEPITPPGKDPDRGPGPPKYRGIPGIDYDIWED